MRNIDSEEEIRLDGYLASVWRAKWLITLAVILAALAAAFIAARQATMYKSSALIKVGRVWKEPLEDPFAVAERINSNGFLSEIAKKASVSPVAVKKAIQAETVSGGPQRATYPILIRVVASTDSYDESIRLVRTVGDEVLAMHQSLFDQSIASRRDYQAQLEKLAAAAPRSVEESARLLKELDEVRSANNAPTVTETTTILGGSIVPGGIIKPDVLTKTAEAATIAFILAVLIALVWFHFRAALQTPTPRRSETEQHGRAEP